MRPERMVVGRGDLVGAQTPTRNHELITRGDDRDERTPPHRQRGAVHGGGEPDRANRKQLPGFQNDLAFGEIEAAAADMLPSGHRASSP